MGLRQKLLNRSFTMLDNWFREKDRQYIKRTKNILRIPGHENRRGGKLAYGEWAHVIGIFQTLIYDHLEKTEGNQILDVGCGTGLFAIASEPYVQLKGCYTGIDVQKREIDFCREHFKAPYFQFEHLDYKNAAYTKLGTDNPPAWQIQNNSQHLVTALSVWTHLNEKDARFYLSEVNRVLRPGGKAIISFFCLDEIYRKTLPEKNEEIGKFHSTPKKMWVYDKQAYDSKHWKTTPWAQVPEHATGIEEEGLKELITNSGLEIHKYYPGSWKEVPGLYFQDIFILKKG